MNLSRFSFPLLAMLALSACGGPEAPQGVGMQSGRSLATTTAATGVTTFNGKRANYTLAKTADGVSVTDLVGQEGVVNLVAPKRLLFTDIAIAFDIDGTAGKAYRIYQAAFNRTPDYEGLGYWIDQMDKGMSLDAVAAGFVGSQEFAALYGARPSNADMVGKFYQNVLHRAPDQAGYDYWVSVLDKGQASPPSVLASFGESPENKALLAPSIGSGFYYTVYKPPVPLPALSVAILAACPDANAVQSGEFYQCMVGTIKGKTTFGNTECTLSIAADGKISLAAGTSTRTLQSPYRFPVYSKVSAGASDSFFMAIDTHDAAMAHFDFKATSPKYAALSSALTPGIEAGIDGLSCKFPSDRGRQR